MISFVLLALAATAVTAQSGASRVRSNVVSARSGSGDTFVCPQKSRFNEDLVLVTYSGDPADTFYAQCNYGTNIGSGSSTATSFCFYMRDGTPRPSSSSPNGAGCPSTAAVQTTENYMCYLGCPSKDNINDELTSAVGRANVNFDTSTNDLRCEYQNKGPFYCIYDARSGALDTTVPNASLCQNQALLTNECLMYDSTRLTRMRRDIRRRAKLEQRYYGRNAS